MKHRIILIGFMVLLVAGCQMETGFQSTEANQAKTTEYEWIVTKEGVECVALGFLGLSGRGLSCNWEKYNSERGN
jgi:hypothetical protein